jgi:two-component system cell cycle sensor histidine kinase/response regulator CckA
MANTSPVPEPTRALEIARLELARLAPTAPLDQVFRLACELSAEALDVERVGVWLFIDNNTVLRCANLFEHSKSEHSAGAVLHVADFPTYFKSLNIRKAIPAEIAMTEPWTAELARAYLLPLGIASMLDAGIFVEGKLVGVVCHEHVGYQREWTTEARDFVGSIADLLALRIQAAEVRELRSVFLTQQERLAAQDKSISLEHLAAGVAHDFKNLLMVIVSYAEILTQRADLPDEAQQQSKEIFDAAQRGVTLVKDLLDFARPNERPPAVLQLIDALTEFLPLLQAAVGSAHPIRYQRPKALGQVLMDKTQLLRLLMNLVINAREAMPKGGPIEMRLRSVRLTNDPSYNGRFVLLEVTDQGTGMDEATLKHVFDPYFTTKSNGSGLGLPAVRHIVDRVGGLIRIESKPNQGTTFRIFLPSIGTSTGETGMYPIPPQLVDR